MSGTTIITNVGIFGSQTNNSVGASVLATRFLRVVSPSDKNIRSDWLAEGTSGNPAIQINAYDDNLGEYVGFNFDANPITFNKNSLGNFELYSGSYTPLISSQDSWAYGKGVYITWDGSPFTYDGYSQLQIDGYASVRGSFSLLSNIAYGQEYGGSFDFNSIDVGGDNWRMLSTGNADGIGAGFWQLYQGSTGISSFSIAPDRSVIFGDAQYMSLDSESAQFLSEDERVALFQNLGYGGVQIKFRVNGYPDYIWYATDDGNSEGAGKMCENRGNNGAIAFYNNGVGWTRCTLDNGAQAIGSYVDDGSNSIFQINGGLTAGRKLDTGNYTIITEAGKINLYGTARVNKPLNLGVGVVGSGTNQPTVTKVGNSFGYKFLIGDDVYLTPFEIPYEWDSSTDIKFKIHLYSTNTVASRYVKFQVNFTDVAEGNGLVNKTTTSVNTGDILLSTKAYNLTEATITIKAGNFTTDSVISIQLSRIASVGTAPTSPADNPVIMSTEIEYVANKLGEQL